MRIILTLLMLLFTTSPLLASEPENRPNPTLTPGGIVTTSKALVCMKGFSKMIRRTTYEMKRKTYRAYEVRNTKANKIDHLVPLSLGGADTMGNIWPSDFNAAHHTAADKDRLELKIRKLVCDSKMSVRKGQRLFIKDWHTAYDKYCPTRKACPSYKEIMDRKEQQYKPTKKEALQNISNNDDMKVTAKGVTFFDGLITIDFKRMMALIVLFFEEIEKSNS